LTSSVYVPRGKYEYGNAGRLERCHSSNYTRCQ
jgi:hypothetical protein